MAKSLPKGPYQEPSPDANHQYDRKGKVTGTIGLVTEVPPCDYNPPVEKLQRGPSGPVEASDGRLTTNES
jgi:hypothetical protein